VRLNNNVGQAECSLAGQTLSTLPERAWPLVCTFVQLLDLVSAELPQPFAFGGAAPPAGAAGGARRQAGAAAGHAARRGQAAADAGLVLTSSAVADREVTLVRFQETYIREMHKVSLCLSMPAFFCASSRATEKW